MDYIDYVAQKSGLDPRLLDPGNFIALGVQQGKHRFVNRHVVETNCMLRVQHNKMVASMSKDKW